MTTPSYVTASALAEASSGNLTVSWHASPVANDVAFCVCMASNTNAITWPAGWTKVVQVNGPGSSFSAAWAWSRLTGSESGTFSVTHSGSVPKGTMFGVWRGCIATGTPYEDADSNSGTGDTVTGVTVDTTDVERLVLFLSGYDIEIVGAQPSGFTDRINQLVTPNAGGHLQISEIARAVAGTQAAPTSVHTAGAADWASFGCALIPAVTSGSSIPKFMAAYARRRRAA